MAKEPDRLSTVAGVKQVRRALSGGRARRLLLARDADPQLTRALAEHFYSQAEGIARRFDLRNDSGWYRTDLELAGREPVTMPG